MSTHPDPHEAAALTEEYHREKTENRRTDGRSAE
jgi:hypothetical protein